MKVVVMSTDAAKGPTATKGCLSLLAGGMCAVGAVGNTHPATAEGLAITLAFGLASLALAVVALWERNGVGVPLALLGAGASVLAMRMGMQARAWSTAIQRESYVSLQVGRLADSLTAYAKANGRLPPAAVYGQGGQPLLSWRVLLLPTLEQEGKVGRSLFARFKLDEPWDSPHNLPLLKEMPEAYALPRKFVEPEPGLTHYRVFVGKGAAFDGPEGVSLADFPDGPEQTFLVVEAAEAVPWTKPDELDFASGKPLPALGFALPHFFMAAMTDGSVRRVDKGIPEASLRAVISRNGGEKVPPGWYNSPD
jgi:hypothetical protein